MILSYHFFNIILNKVNNINMLDKIKKIINLYQEITKTYSLRILTSAITYNLILIIIPLLILLNVIMNQLGLPVVTNNLTNYEDEGIVPTIILVINLFWSTSTLFLTFNQTGDTIYHTVKKRGYLESRIKSFIYFFLIVIFVVLAVFIIFLINKIINLTDILFIKTILNVLELLCNLISIWLISAFIYKKIIPVKVSFKKSLMVSMVITIVWYILTTLFFPLLNFFLSQSYSKMYQSLASLFIIIYYLYILVKVFIIGIIFLYYLYAKKE